MAPPSAKRTGFSRRAQFGVFIGYVAAASGVVVGLVLVLLSFFNPPVFAAIRSAVAEVTTPISSGMAGLRRAASSPGSLTDYFGGADKIRTLRAQLAREHAIVMRARMINAENRRLRALLRIRDIEVTPVATARLVSSSAGSTRRFAVLNAGRAQGVEPGMPVRGPEGLIGRVIETGFNSARVLLLIDAESIVPVRRTRDNLPAIASGRGDGQLDIRSAGSANAPFRAGDTFVTSGTGGLYPPNIPVARVTDAARDAAPGRMLADPDSLDFALVQRAFRPAPLPERPPAAP
jgi:rod shape-determining protein MreC